jgi:hypothetical protein
MSLIGWIMKEIEGGIAQVSARFAAAGVRLLRYEPEDFIIPEPSTSSPVEPQLSSCKPWPHLQHKANLGIVGEIAELATRNSEADPIAVMGTALAFGAATFGRSRFMSVGDSTHHPRLFCALVGASSRARKGTSIDPVRRIFTAAETELQLQSTLPFPSGLSLRLSNGPLSSGEGLVDAIRDRREDEEDTGGTEDKRMLCIEGEFGAVLRSCQRQGNNLSTMLRVAWDGWTMAPLTKNNKIVATDPHICIIAHVTGAGIEGVAECNRRMERFRQPFSLARRQAREVRPLSRAHA